jgi:hypothetical protein
MAVLVALIVGGIAGTLLTKSWVGSSSGSDGPAVPLFAVAASKVSPQQKGPAGEYVLGGQLTVLNPGRLPIAVATVSGELSGVTVSGAETPPRNVGVGGQSLVGVKVVVPRAQCSAGNPDTVFPTPIPLTVTLVGASKPATTALELAGTGWDESVRAWCAAAG